ncbi:MAG: hypothetical protein ACRDZ1_15725 [Acidimicrobiia bacterium]
MPDAELDHRIRAVVVEVVETSPPPPSFESIQAGSLEPALPSRRRRRVARHGVRHVWAAMVALLVALSAIVIALVAVWLVGSDPDDPDRPARQNEMYEQPTEPATSVVSIEALPSLQFNAAEYVVEAGIVEIDYVSRGGAHTLVFAEQEFTGFKLFSPGDGRRDTGKVQLEPGQYTVYCDIPGHRAAGEEATITVRAASPDPAEDGHQRALNLMASAE